MTESGKECQDPVHKMVSGQQRGSASRDVPLPSREAVIRLLDHAKAILFPSLRRCESGHEELQLDEILARFRQELRCQIKRAFLARCREESERDLVSERARRICCAHVESLPSLQVALESDVEAALEGDPALHSRDEAILCYPGIFAVMCHRMAHDLHSLEVPLLPRMIAAHAHSVTGIDIHPGAQVGEHFFIDHGTGVVIGETAIIGHRVRLYQGVTLGAKSFPKGPDGKILKGIPRHPILEDDVVVYSWASILGRVTIGRRSVIGGNVWVTRDVPPDSLVTQAQARQTEFADGAGI